MFNKHRPRRADGERWLAISGQDKHRDDGGTTPSSPTPADGTGTERLDALKHRIRDAEQNSRERGRAGRSATLPAGALAIVGRIATELVAGVAVGGLIGWLLDNWLGTTPWFMIGLLFLGAGAGMMNIWRLASGHGLKVGYFDQDAGASDEGKNRKDR